MATDNFAKGNEEFVNENYEKALELYTEALKTDDEDMRDDYYAARAQVLLKLERFSEALEDTNKSTEINPKNSKAYYRRGIALFHLERFDDALKVFTAGHVLNLNAPSRQSENSNFNTWIRKCEAEIDLSKQEKSSGAEARVGVSDSSPMETSSSKESEKKTESSSITKPNPADAVLNAPVKAKHDWYQTQTHVVLTILIKNVPKDDCHVDVQERSLSCTVKLPSGNDYSLELDLAHNVIPDKTLTKVLSSKIEIKMKKQAEIQWKKLEGDGQEEEKIKQIPIQNPTDTTHKYPTSSHKTRNWDKLEQEVKEEEKTEKLEGDAALNKLFQQIYSDGTDETKKAMMKSFSESGGTVLSTNWGEIGEKKTEIKPPDGMEYKKWEC
ncbi:protein SGT1 homolog isoform X1 [Mytilus trossulus]|uniref:protein SGT1 homolog isoform X1 n=1 Tax=Mytilus trossulus TaxID=6551 RepID=UPI0030065627